MTAMPFMRMHHDTDPKQALLDEMGPLDDLEVFNNQVLVAIYVRPNKTKGGIMLSEQTRDEDKWQGKVGLVVKKGPTAFKDEEDTWFKDIKVEVGDWVVCRPGDGWNINVHNVMCRMIADYDIRGRVSAPDAVW
jgi:co-chaperonin GroES (HSP10)